MAISKEAYCSLLKSIDHLDRVFAGCCQEVLIARQYPGDSSGALRQEARSLTLTLTSYLAVLPGYLKVLP